ncbi:MAG: iron-sulfur cluster assembly protein [Thermodesulfobacteriota bacterium]
MGETTNLEQAIESALCEVIDPETGLSVTRMDLVHDIQVGEGGAVRLTFRPSSPVCPLAYALANSIKQSVEGVPGVDHVKIKVENYQRANHLESVINARD